MTSTNNQDTTTQVNAPQSIRGRDGAGHPSDGIDAQFQLISSAHTPASMSISAGAASPTNASHRPPRLLRIIMAILVLLVLGAVGWWVVTSGWTPPWMQPPGPLVASGTLEADEVLVGAEISGRIIQLVQEGQSIQANDVVAKLDDSLIQIQIQQADLATRQRLEIQLDRYVLRAPLGGVVTRVPMHAGEVVSPGQTVAALADLSVLKLTAYVLEADLGSVRVGQLVNVTADPFDDRVFRGVVTSTNPRAEFTPRNVQTRADRLNLVFGVNILVDNPDGALKPGMPADATFASASQS